MVLIDDLTALIFGGRKLVVEPLKLRRYERHAAEGGAAREPCGLTSAAWFKENAGG